MPRVSVGTTSIRNCPRAHDGPRPGLADSALVDEALASLLSRHRAVEIDAAYAAYETLPLETADEWGDLASSRAAAAGS